MKLNHLNLTVSNVSDTSTFFEKYFGFSCLDKKGDSVLNVMYGQDGFILTLMSEAFNKTGSQDYPAAFHLGFILPTAEAVTQLYQQLKADGISLEKEPANIRNSFGFYFHYDRLMIEIGYYFK